jgi:hypothetical protein
MHQFSVPMRRYKAVDEDGEFPSSDFAVCETDKDGM